MLSAINEGVVASSNPTAANSPATIDEESPLVINSPLNDEKSDIPSDKTQIEAESQNSLAEFKRPISDTRWLLVTVGLLLGAFLYGLDTTIAADVQGPILVSLGDLEKLPWVGIGFPMGSVSVILLVGCLNSLFNIKYLLNAGFIIFEIGSAVCGSAPNMNAMICGRIIAGIGGAAMYLGALTYISIFTSHKKRPLYNALIGICWGTGCIAGPLIGGGFATSSATWRWAFYINLPLCALFSPIYIFINPSFNPKPDIPELKKLASIDWVGVILHALVFTIFQVVLTLSGPTWQWNSAGSITLWTIFGVLFIFHCLQQYFCLFTTPERRLFPVQFLKSRTLILLFMSTASAASAVFVSVFYVPVFFQFTKGDTAIHAAVRLLPFIIVMVVFVLISGGSLPQVGRYMPYYAIGGALVIIGASLMHTVNSETLTNKIYGYEVLVAAGAGLTFQIAYTVVVVKVSAAEVPAAIGFINVGQIGGVTIALSIAGSIYQNIGFIKLREALALYNFSDSELREALGGATSAILENQDTVKDQALAAIVTTISQIWVMIIAAGALCFVSSLCMKREKLQLENITVG